MRIDHVQLAIPAGGEDEARGFFVDLLGFVEEPRPPDMAGRGGGWFRHGAAVVHLGVDPAFTPARKAHPALEVDDLPGLAARLSAAGHAVTRDERIPGRPRVHVHDPFGNRIELMAPSDVPRMYADLAIWWPLLSAPAEYAEEAAFYARALERGCATPPRTVLELGSGGGNNASHLSKRWSMTLVDRAPAMLDVSRALNPGCEHVLGDMRDVRLGRVFDAVFVHDAVTYLTTPDEVRAAIATARLHCAPGGAALFAPDHVRETFRPSTEHGGHDASDGSGRSLRYLSHTWDPDPGDSLVTVDFAFQLREGTGPPRIESERHVVGLFGRDDWLGWLADGGFEARAVPFEHSEAAPGEHEIFVGRRTE